MRRAAIARDDARMNERAKASTGVAQLDDVLGGLFWGDNVVWEAEHRETVAPFVAAALQRPEQFAHIAFVSLTEAPTSLHAAHPGIEVIDARTGSKLEGPGPLLAAVQACAQRAPRVLLVFESLDAMSERWGHAMAQRFFIRACPMLLDLWAVAYWSLTPSRHPVALRTAVDATTQCVLVLGDDRLRVAKAEGRPPGVQGTVFHLRRDFGGDTWEPAAAGSRLGTALRAVRIQRHITQAELAHAAGVSASAISQAERGLRGLSLDTLLTLTARLDITLDELLRGEIALGYRLARRLRPDDTNQGLVPLLSDPRAGLRVSLARLGTGEASSPDSHRGIEVVAVAYGLVQVVLPTGRPVLRAGEALMSEWSEVSSLRNVGEREASVFLIRRDEIGPARPKAPEPSQAARNN